MNKIRSEDTELNMMKAQMPNFEFKVEDIRENFEKCKGAWKDADLLSYNSLKVEVSQPLPKKRFKTSSPSKSSLKRKSEEEIEEGRGSDG